MNKYINNYDKSALMLYVCTQSVDGAKLCGSVMCKGHKKSWTAPYRQVDYEI